MNLGIVSRLGEFPEKFWPAEFELADKEKLDHIELLVSNSYLTPNYKKEQVNKINSWAEKYNLKIILHPWLNQYLVDGKNPFDLASLDEKIRNSSIETVKRLYGLAKLLNAKIISFHGGFFKNFRDYGKNLRASRKSFEELNPLFKNVKLCVENLPVKGHFGNLVKELPIEAPDILYLIEGLDNIGICLDIGHANNIENALDFYNKIKESGKIWSMHIDDNTGDRDDHLPLGKGNIDFRKFLGKLKQDNYKSYFSIELDTFNEESMEQKERIAALKYLRNLGLRSNKEKNI